MYSGSDSTGSQNFNQWPLNPAAYQNTPNEQIDWAALAQQWIIMKEAGPPVPDQMPTTTPPINIQKAKKESLPEGGEAPMEVENDKEDDAQPHWNDNTSAEGYWNQQQQWGWGNTWSAPSGVPPPGIAKAPLLPTPPSYQYSCPSDNTSNFGGYNRPPSSEYSGGYWTATGNKIKPHNKRYSKVNVPPRPTITPTTPEPVMLDASKRKQLPAWIREGLEKMERDKQKQLERERDKIEKEDHKEMSKLNEKEALEIIKSTVKERERSKFESDGEDSEIESNNQEKVSELSESPILTQEELMMKLRRTMTEILLKVTNQEIRAVCKEEFQRHLRKYKASDLRISASGGTNISAKLGLGIYGDSASSSEDTGGESEQDKNDSDAELKDTIKRRKAEFTKTEREIEERLGAVAHVDDESRGGTPKADDCDSQVDAKSQGHKLKLNEDITPPKNVSSISKRFKSRRTSTSSSTKSDTEHDKHAKQKDKKVNRPKKSSSIESNHSQKRSKIRNKRSQPSKDTRSITPERKKVKEKNRHSNDKKTKHSESSSSKSSSSRSRKSRSKSVEVLKKKRLHLSDKYGRDHTNHRRSYSKRSHSRSSSRSRRSRSYTRSHRSESRRRSRSYIKSDKSRSRSRSDHSLNSRSRKSVRSQKSRSRDRRSRSTNRRKTSRSRQKSKSYSPRSHRHRRLKSRSSSRGKRSHRH